MNSGAFRLSHEHQCTSEPQAGTHSYDPTQDNPATVAAIYNCSALPVQTYNLSSAGAAAGIGSAATTTTNPPPYCAELFNPRSLPWGFFSFPLPGFGGVGYPAFIDINLSQEASLAWAQYLQDGLYLDVHTQ